MFSRSKNLNSKTVKVICFLGPVILFIAFAIAIKYFPIFIEDTAFAAPSKEEITKVMEQGNYQLETENDIDKERLITMFKLQIEYQSDFDGYINAMVKIIDLLANSFVLILLMYLASLLFIYTNYIKKKTQ